MLLSLTSRALPMRAIGLIFLWSIIISSIFVPAFGTKISTDSNSQPSGQNSTVACTRGAGQSQNVIRPLHCHDNNGTATGILAMNKLFYGTTPKTSNCGRKAPYDACCRQDPDENCVFESDFLLDDLVMKCSGKSKCYFHGQSVNSIRGNCSQAAYPSITSFTFVEYSCLSKDNLINVCPKEETTTEGLKLFLDSNLEHDNGRLVSDDECSCVLYTRCGATLTLEAIFVQLRMINTTDCVEEITLQDLKVPSIKSEYSCLDHKLNYAINNQIMIKSSSNAVLFQLHLFHNHNGKLLISAVSSDPTSSVGLKCGPKISAQDLPSDYHCEGYTPPVDDTTTEPETSGEQGSESDQNIGGGGGTVVIKKESEDLHSGAIAGIVLAIVGICLVISQVIYFLYRRRHHKSFGQRHHEDNDMSDMSSRTGGGSSSSTPQQMENPTFQPDFGVTTTYNNDNNFDEEEHIYDRVGTISMRPNAIYSNRIVPDYVVQGVDTVEAYPDKKDGVPDSDLPPPDLDLEPDEDYVELFHVMPSDPPPPYEH